MLGDLSETLGEFREDIGRLLGSGTETDKETDRKTIRETDRGDRLGNRLGDRPGYSEIDRETLRDFLREFLKTSGALPVTGGRRATNLDIILDGRSQKPICFKAFRRHRPPILEGKRRQSAKPNFFRRNNQK